MYFSALLGLLQQGQPAPGPGGGLLQMLLMIGPIILIFYFIVIRPARMKQKKHQEMVELLRPGDKVITAGGIHGTVMGVQKDKIELKIASNVKIDIAKSSIAVILTPQDKEKPKKAGSRPFNR